MPRDNERDVIHWLQEREDGCAYLGHLLVRLNGLSRKEQAAFRKEGGFDHGLYNQCGILRELGFANASPEHEEQLIGALVTTINHTGTEDELCPEPLRKWLRYKLHSEEESWGIEVARRYWPGRSRKRDLLRGVFTRAVSHLARCKELADHLVDRDDPRLLARALVNHLLGAAKAKDFQKAPEAKRTYVVNLCADEQHVQAVESLRYLLTAKCANIERKDVPAKRLKEALADQFRIWRASRYASPEHFAKQAVLLLPPWFLDEIKGRRFRVKEMGYRLSEHLSVIGRTPSIEACKRFLRANAFRSRLI